MKKKLGDKINIEYNGKSIDVDDEKCCCEDKCCYDEKLEVKTPTSTIIDLPTSTLEELKPLSYFNKETLESITDSVYNKLVADGIVNKKDDIDITEVYNKQKTEIEPIVEVDYNDDNDNVMETSTFKDAYMDILSIPVVDDTEMNDYCNEISKKCKDINDRLENVDNSRTLNNNALCRKYIVNDNKPLDINYYEVIIDKLPMFNSNDVSSIRLLGYPNSIEIIVESNSLDYLKIKPGINVGDIIVKFYHKDGEVKIYRDELVYKDMCFTSRYSNKEILANKETSFSFEITLYFYINEFTTPSDKTILTTSSDNSTYYNG
jgi:hypothetical protein